MYGCFFYRCNLTNGRKFFGGGEGVFPVITWGTQAL